MNKVGSQHPFSKLLQDKGYSIRLSRDIVNCVFDGIKEALFKSEEVDLPFGKFSVIPETRKKQRRIGLHGPEWVYKRSKKVKFEYKD